METLSSSLSLSSDPFLGMEPSSLLLLLSAIFCVLVLEKDHISRSHCLLSFSFALRLCLPGDKQQDQEEQAGGKTTRKNDPSQAPEQKRESERRDVLLVVEMQGGLLRCEAAEHAVQRTSAGKRKGNGGYERGRVKWGGERRSR